MQYGRVLVDLCFAEDPVSVLNIFFFFCRIMTEFVHICRLEIHLMAINLCHGPLNIDHVIFQLHMVFLFKGPIVFINTTHDERITINY